MSQASLLSAALSPVPVSQTTSNGLPVPLRNQGELELLPLGLDQPSWADLPSHPPSPAFPPGPLRLDLRSAASPDEEGSCAVGAGDALTRLFSRLQQRKDPWMFAPGSSALNFHPKCNVKGKTIH